MAWGSVARERKTAGRSDGRERSVALVERTMSRENRDEEILRLRKRGMSLRKIAKRVEMTPSGVAHALERLGRKR